MERTEIPMRVVAFGVIRRITSLQLQDDKAVAIKMYHLYKKYPELEIVEKSGRHRLDVRKGVLRHAPRNSIGAEIGVYTGLFSDVLAEEIPSERIYLVDPWSKLHGSHFPSWGNYSANISLSTDAAKEAALWRANTADSECIVVEDFSTDWLSQFREPFLGWVYLDAKHTFEAVMTDLEAIEKCLLPDGTIMGDDMWIPGKQGISELYFAVRTFCQTRGFDIIHIDEHAQWAIKRTATVDSLAASSAK